MKNKGEFMDVMIKSSLSGLAFGILIFLSLAVLYNIWIKPDLSTWMQAYMSSAVIMIAYCLSYSFKKVFFYPFVLGLLLISLFTNADAQYNVPANFPPSKLLFDRDLTKPGYTFVPTGIVTSNRAQIWYAGSDSKNYGDHVMYRNAKTIDGPFGIDGKNTYEVALRPTHFDGKLNTFDAWHTCDPTVVKVGNDFYMYYGGAALAPDGTNHYPQRYITEIGIAKSADGRKWTRVNQGRSMLRSNPDVTSASGNVYGTGQPSAVYLNGYVYLFYTDTVSPNSNSTNGAGVYVVRSTDPTFFNGTQAWTTEGWISIPNTGISEPKDVYLKRVSKPVALVVSVDVQYNPTLNKFLMGIHGIEKTLELAVINVDNFNVEWVGKTLYDTKNADGPGFFRGANGWSVLGSGNTTDGLVPIRAIHAATDTDVFGTRLRVSNELLSWGNGIPGPLPQPTPVPTVSPTPNPAKTVWGYDDLGLASHCSIYLRAPPLPGLSTVLEVFGDPIPCIERAIKERGVNNVQVDLIDATCWRNHVCLPGASRPDDLSEIKRRAKTIQVLVDRYPTVKFTVSPALEHDVLNTQTVVNMLEAAGSGCTGCSVINSPVSGATPKGYDVEWHGTTKTGVSISGDGSSLFDGDNLSKRSDGNDFQHRLAGKKNTWAWWNELNDRCTGERDYIYPDDRTVRPELWQYQMAHKIFTTEEDAYPIAPRVCRRVRRFHSPEINKPTAERYCNGQPNSGDIRGNKNLLIIKKAGQKGNTMAILASSNKQVGCVKLYGSYSTPGTYRWYEGDCSGLNPWELYNALGNEWGFVNMGNGDCLMFNSLRREGVYR